LNAKTVAYANLTPAAARALEAAQLLASRLGFPETLPVHLLHGLLEEEEGRAAVLLTQAGLAVGRVELTLVERSTGVPGQPGVRPGLHFKTQEVFDYAREVAGDLSGERQTTSEHLLLALLRRDQDLRRELSALGLDFSRLEAAVASSQVPLVLEEPLHLSEATERIETARILDASANRAREALRVIEDYCRFALDDRFLSEQAKQLRHDLAEILTSLPPTLLLEARDTLGDVGTTLSTTREYQRSRLAEVVRANLSRLQEALRSLEEYGKLHSPRLGQGFEQVRYRCYTLERAVVLGTQARQRLADARLYVLVSGAACTAALDWTIQEAAAGGAQVIQLREKNLNDRELLERARKVRAWTRKAGVLFIMNDRPDIARLAEADGVHVGQEELPIKEVRRVLGPDALIGVSTHTIEQVRHAILEGASYLGVGPTFASSTKHFNGLPGLDFVRAAAGETSLPAFVIGGINQNTLPAAVAAGARRVAVSEVICRADDPRAVAAELLRLLVGT
jgi:thiamine-phosphate pyrophosphorylase